MGKNHRHKKDLKAEKAKTKLKQTKTKFLPKGLNITNTTFKVKSIVIPEQLKKKDDEEILSKRKLNVKDLLTRIKHYSENVRHLACEELADIIQVYTEEVVQQHLSSICLAISSLMQDKENKVRKDAVKCIQTMLRFIPHSKLVPFFDYFSTNLRCAMTNIDKNIQEDSLLFLDCFIHMDCGLIVKTSDKLLPDFLSLISKLRSDSQVGRTLTLNLGSKMTSIAWRIKVLSRLYAILNMIISQEDTVGNVYKRGVDALKTPRFGLYKYNYAERLEKSSANIFGNQVSLVSKETNNFNQHIIALIPLLHETWLEVMPEGKVKKAPTESTDLNEETAMLLSCILNILYLLWKYVKRIQNENISVESVFLTSHGRKFLLNLLSDFPYCQLGAKSRKKKGSNALFIDANDDPKCTKENLLICYLYSIIFVKVKHGSKKEANTITAFITKCLFQNKSFKEEEISCLVRFFRLCFEGNQQDWRYFGFDLRTMLENLITFYECANVSHKDRLCLFRLLSMVNDNSHLNKLPKFEQWLSSLPNALCEENITDAMVFELLQLSKKNCTVFHAALVKSIPEILANLDNIKIIYEDDSISCNEDHVKRNIANIFYFLSRGENLQPIKDYVNSDELSSEYKKYFEEMLKLRAEFNRI
ncbi:hypothetical protein GWI33_021713 [Rhynchophorus ferrugineus]|uniref:Pre-rRNA-processing protein Ipi1 N-terminal domain-containing protein n=1 Tax=Rhynchophorus ferrugineus TaxID=354439 RepID=A0A834MLL1_RHYFE|nr:hypothetical protein GWI33_021713 [Rhynchophorus ferrugineus]